MSLFVPGAVAALTGRPSAFPRGGRLDEAFLISRTINHVRKTYFRPGLVNAAGAALKAEFFVADLPTADGFAMAHGGVHYLGLTLGHYASSYVLSALMAKLGAFCLSPASERESVGEIALPTRLRVGEEFFAAAADPAWLDRFLQAIAPIDPLKRRLAHRLAFAMNTFGLLHELAHAELGHCEFGAESLGMRRLSERARVELSPKDSRTAVLMEADADWYALARLLHVHADTADHFLGIFGATLGVQDQLAMLFLACLLITMSWFAEDDISESESPVHPRPMVRAMLMASVIHAQAVSNGVDRTTIETAMQHAVEALRRVEEFFPDVEAVRDLGRDEQDYVGAVDTLILGKDALDALLADFRYR
jgi:hypothetical protein